MVSKAFVMAGGSGSRWKNYQGVPKHLIELEGEQLIARTIRQFEDLEPTVIAPTEYLSYNLQAPVVPGSRPTGLDIDKIMSSRLLWPARSRTVILYGDVWFSDEAVGLIKQEPPGVKFYGRFNASKFTGKPWGEIFALSISYRAYAAVDAAVEYILTLKRNGGVSRTSAWELYRTLNGIRPITKHSLNGNFVEIDDWTEDFDFPVDYDRWVQRRRGRLSTNPQTSSPVGPS